MSDWTRACAHLKGSLEAMILLFGKLDSRTISVAKLLHSARKGRAGGVGEQNENNAEEEGEDEEVNSPRQQHGNDHGQYDKDKGAGKGVYGPEDVISTPRTIEVAANALSGYKDVADLISPAAIRNNVNAKSK